jgi:ketosteroid isomerase-like protein
VTRAEARGRRLFLRAGVAAAVGVVASSVETFSFPRAPQADQNQREEVEAFVRGLYEAKDRLDARKFASYFSDPHDYLDSVSGYCALLEPPKAVEDRYGNGMFKRIGVPGRLCRFLNATGDMRYGLVAECANLPGGVFNDGCDLMAVMELKDGRISRNTDHWDSRQLGAGAFAVHPNGAPLQRDACRPSVIPGDPPHASREMLDFARDFHDALAAARPERVMKFFTEDALFIHPLLHRGPAGYDVFNRGTQRRGKASIERFLKGAQPLLPDAANSTIVNVVGGKAGGGIEWKAGGVYAHQGLTRDGIPGVTAFDLFGGLVQRMSVKFDTMQMTADQRAAIVRG